eukprot:7744696-Karenia_brevis.AAC.1
MQLDCILQKRIPCLDNVLCEFVQDQKPSAEAVRMLIEGIYGDTISLLLDVGSAGFEVKDAGPANLGRMTDVAGRKVSLFYLWTCAWRAHFRTPPRC